MSSPQDRSAERERRMAEELWLHYLNRYLEEAGVISQKEYSRMTELIASRKRSKSPLRGILVGGAEIQFMKFGAESFAFDKAFDSAHFFYFLAKSLEISRFRDITNGLVLPCFEG